MSELSQYMFEYNKGWKPNWNEGDHKYCINIFGENFYIESYITMRQFLAFESREIAEIFLKNFESLIKQYYNGF